MRTPLQCKLKEINCLLMFLSQKLSHGEDQLQQKQLLYQMVIQEMYEASLLRRRLCKKIEKNRF